MPYCKGTHLKDGIHNQIEDKHVSSFFQKHNLIPVPRMHAHTHTRMQYRYCKDLRVFKQNCALLRQNAFAAIFCTVKTHYFGFREAEPVDVTSMQDTTRRQLHVPFKRRRDGPQWPGDATPAAS